MPKFAANVTTMFQELPMPERIQAAADVGFKAAELLFPYAWSPGEIATWPGRDELRLILINTDPGETAGRAALVDGEQAFRDSFLRTLEYVEALDVPMIHLMAGRTGEGVEISEDVFIANVAWAAERAGDRLILLEPLNTRDMPGYLHTTSNQTLKLLDAIGAFNVKMQFDFYHMQVMEGHLVHTLEKYLDRIGHIQFSSMPGRHEPQYGEVNVDYLFDWLDQAGYDGWVGCEYTPLGDTRAGLGWASRWGINPDAGS